MSWLLLRNIHSFVGFGKGELPPPPAAPISEHPEPLPEGAGLRDDSAGQLHLEKNPVALIVPEMGAKLTFSRLEGQPQLTVTLRSRTSSWRYSSDQAILLIIAAAAFAYRKSRKSDIHGAGWRTQIKTPGRWGVLILLTSPTRDPMKRRRWRA